MAKYSIHYSLITPKFHEKNQISEKRSSLKSLYKYMRRVLRLVDRTTSSSDKYQFDFKDASGYLIAKNKDKALADLNYLNHTFHGHSIMSFG